MAEETQKKRKAMTDTKKDTKKDTKPKRGKTENLKKFGSGGFTAEEEKAIREKGQIKAAQTRRLKKEMREVCATILECFPTLDKRTIANFQAMGIDGEGEKKDRYSAQVIATAAMVQKAMRGDLRAYTIILEMMGEDPQSVIASNRMYLQEMMLKNGMQPEIEADDGDGFLDALNSSAKKGVFDNVPDEPLHIE